MFLPMDTSMVNNACSYLSMSKTTSLLDLMPEPTTDNGIFTYLADFPFIEPAYNNPEYLYNRSGDKVPSPLVTRLADGDTLTQVSLQSLANIIKMRFRFKWNRLWETYTDSNPLWNTLSITESQTDSGVTSDTTTDTSYLSRSSAESKSRDTTDTTVLTGGHSDTSTASDTSTSTRTGSMLEAEGGSTIEAKTTSGQTVTNTQHSGTIGDTKSSGGETSRWGFNSTVPVNVTAETSADGNLRTFGNSDVTTDSPNVGENKITAHGKTNTTSYNNIQDGVNSNTAGTTKREYNSETSTTSRTGSDTTTKSDSGSTNRNATKSGTSYLSRSTETSGFNIRHLSDKTEIIKLLFTDPSFSDFWEVIYSDIDDVLTCPIFV